MSMKRCDNWPAKLDLFIEEKRRHVFDWTTNNCAFFAADWVAMLTSVDPASSFRDEVTGPMAAKKALERHGGIVEIAAQAFGRWNWPAVPAHLAQRGDVVVTETDSGPALGVFLGHCAAFVGADGLMFVPPAKLTGAWRIG